MKYAVFLACLTIAIFTCSADAGYHGRNLIRAQTVTYQAPTASLQIQREFQYTAPIQVQRVTYAAPVTLRQEAACPPMMPPADQGIPIAPAPIRQNFSLNTYAAPLAVQRVYHRHFFRR